MIDREVLALIKARDAAPAPTPLEARDAAAVAVRKAFFDPPEHGVDVTGPDGLRRAVQAHYFGATGTGQDAANTPPDGHADPGGSSTPGGADSGAASGGSKDEVAAARAEVREAERAYLAELEAQLAQLGDLATRILALEERQQKRGR